MMRNIKALSHQWYALEWQLKVFDTCRLERHWLETGIDVLTLQTCTAESQFPLKTDTFHWQ